MCEFFSMTILDFIQKHRLSSPSSKLCDILVGHNFYRDIESSLNDFLQSVSTRNTTNIIAQLVLTMREYVSVTYKVLSFHKDEQQSEILNCYISDLTRYFIKETLHLSDLDSVTYFRLFIQISNSTYLKYEWDLTILASLLNSINESRVLSKEQKQHADQIKFSKPIKLDWCGRQPLDFFIDDMVKTFKGVKCKRRLYQLFEDISMDIKVEMPSKYLLAFLTLFQDLHKYGTIKVIGNRGLFIFLHNHLQAPANDRYPSRDFRKLSYDAKCDYRLKNQIANLINPLLDKYGGLIKPDDRRTIDFS